MKIEILKTADKYYDDNTMAKELACIEMLEGLAWDINSTKHVLKRCEDDVKDALSGGMMDYAKIRKKAVLEYRKELEDKKNKFNEILTFLNNL